MLQLADTDFKIIMLNMLKNLEKIWQKMDDFNTVIKI